MNKGGCAVLVFSKAPVPGTVKTRLLPELNADDAARLCRDLLERTLDTITGNAQWHTQLWCTPAVDHPCFLECRDKYQIELHLQSGRNIGERMYRAISETLRDFRSVLLVGCDCPELQVSDLATAREKLADGYDVVLGPAADGGYYLIGMNAAHPVIFEDIEWGGSSVLTTTINRLRRSQLDYYELPPRWDLDNVEDLEKYRNLFACGL